jgi:Uma2 family endonuclease
VNLIVPTPAAAKEREQMVLYGVDWATYEKLIDAFNELHVRMAYDQGTLELMSPLPRHERLKRWFGLFFTVLSVELDVPVQGMGSTTFRRRSVGRGVEPDECFYLGSISRVRDWDTLDLNVDPPPDLVVEVDITRSVVDRFPIYAALGVGEIWRIQDETLQAYQLAHGAYQAVTPSPNLPFLPLAEIFPLLQRTEGLANEGVLWRAVSDWFRNRVRPLFDAWRANQTPPTPLPPAAP